MREPGAAHVDEVVPAPPAAGPRLAVVVLAWNARADVLRCLESLRGEMRPGDLVILVDNASADGTAEAVREREPAVRVVVNGANLGYAGGMNAGLRVALADPGVGLVLVLNQDTIVPPGTLAALLDAAARRPAFDSFQPLLVRIDERGAEGAIDSAAQRLHRVPGASDWLAGEPTSAAPSAESEIFGACGAAALYRAKSLRRVGLFDEEHFLIFEDVDLAFRLRLGGGRALLVPQVRVLHRRGISGGDAAPSALRRFLVARNGVAIALRYWPARWLVLSAPVLAFRMLRALRLRGATGRVCGPMWSRAFAARSVARSRAAETGMDMWLTTKSVPAEG